MYGLQEARDYDAFHVDRDYYTEAADLRRRFPRARTVLEIGGGTGSLTWWLVRLGFDVTVLEPSEAMSQQLALKLRSELLSGTVTLCRETIQEFVPTRTYDLAVAHYDVLNYVPCGEIKAVVAKLRRCATGHSVQVWPSQRGIRPLTYKQAGGLHRLRLGFRLGRRVHLWFIYWGRGLSISRHRLCLHDLQEFGLTDAALGHQR